MSRSDILMEDFVRPPPAFIGMSIKRQAAPAAIHDASSVNSSASMSSTLPT
jgi:hypothetical protein